MRSLDRAKPVRKKPWASLIAIAALVASVSASAGELDGKAISCDGGDYEFRRGHAVSWMIWVIGSRADLTDYPDLAKKYYTSHSTVWWTDVSSKKDKPFEYITTLWSLDRKTLALTVTVDDEVTKEWNCEVYAVGDFKNMLEARRAETQRRVDESMKDNKI